MGEKAVTPVLADTGSGGAGPARPVSAWRVIVAVAAHRGWLLLFVGLAAAVAFGYSVLLPFAYTQRVALANWSFLDGEMLGFAVALGIGIAAVITLQAYAVRRAVLARRGTATGGFAFVASLLPSLLCCSPLLSVMLTTLGVSAASVISIAVPVQYIFSAYQTYFLAGSLALLLLVGWWSARRIARADCWGPVGCSPPATGEHSAGRGIE